MRTEKILQRERLEQAAKEYRNLGYTVAFQPDPKFVASHGLPGWIRPDLLAIGETDRVLIEVKSLVEARQSDDISRVAAALEDIPGWRFELLLVNPVDGDVVPHEPIPEDVERGVAHSRATSAKRLAATERDAALVLAWAAVEAGLRVIDEAHGVDSDRRGTNIRRLNSLGVLSDRQFEVLRVAAQARSRIVHGLPSEPIDENLILRLTEMAEEFASGRFVSVSDMVEWFLANYKNPVDGVPYSSAEGGYQYVHGGPYNARDVLVQQFPDAAPETIDEAADQIEGEGHEWVRADQY